MERRLTLVYLGLPWPVFLFGWLAPVVALPLILALVAVVAVRLRRASELAVEERPARRGWWMAGLVVTGWVGLSGVGGYGYQNLDWAKHNMLLVDLVERDWPVRYVFADAAGIRTVPLVYYVAYYLPAAFAGKLLGWSAANQFLFLWTLLGALLACRWFARLTGLAPLPAVMLFVASSGLDIAGFWLFGDGPYTPVTHLEWWAGLHTFQYTANTTALFWVPQHALAAWLAASSVLDAQRRSDLRSVLLVVGLTTLWSPFVALGTMPLVLWVLCFSGGVPVADRVRDFTSGGNLLGVLLASLAAGLVLSHSQRLPAGWVFDFVDPSTGVGKLLLFFVLEFGGHLVAATLLLVGRERGLVAPVFLLVVVLLVCPLFHLGRFSDFTMRASLPALLLLWTFTGRALAIGGRPVRRALLVALVLLGACTATAEMLRSLTRYSLGVPNRAAVKSIPDDVFGHQYLGNEQAPFFRWLARPTSLTSAHAEGFSARHGDVQGETSPAGERVVHLGAHGAPARLRYSVVLPRSLSDATAMLRHFTEKSAVVVVRVDGREVGRFDLQGSGGQFGIALLSGEIGPLAAGTRDVEVETVAGSVRVAALAVMERRLVAGGEAD